MLTIYTLSAEGGFHHLLRSCPHGRYGQGHCGDVMASDRMCQAVQHILFWFARISGISYNWTWYAWGKLSVQAW